MSKPQTEVLITVAGLETGRFVMEPGDYVIGRNPDCAIRVEADLVSRSHAKLILNYDHALIEDLGSSNGTQVNGQPVTESTRLWPNQRIQIGTATIELRRLKVEISDKSLAPAQAMVRRVLPEEFLREKRYDIGKVVARGGMGAILNAREATTERTVAMKVMLDTNDPGDIARFLNEAKVTAQLEHPNIVPVHELSVDENGQPYYTMKMVKGITLKKVLELLADGVGATAKKYPLAALLTIFQKVCDAIAFAHSKGVIHRDLKPENIMLGDFGEVLVMDWGLAKVLGGMGAAGASGTTASMPSMLHTSTAGGDTGSRTLSGTVMGTPQFMSPEQARGEVDSLDARSDIYSLGAILYQILSLRVSVTGDDVWAVVGKVGRGEIEPLIVQRDVTPGRKDARKAKGGDPKSSPFAPSRLGVPHLPNGRIPESLAAVVKKAMTLAPDARYPGVADLQRDIEAYQGGFATDAEKAGRWKRFTLFVRRNKAASIGVAAVIVLSVAFTAKVIGEKNRAERILGELRGTAPTFESQSRALVAEGNLDDALAKIGYAVDLAPESADYHLARAHLLQSTQRLSEAEGEYRRVLELRPGDTVAKANLDLCTKLLTENGGKVELPVNLQGKLLDALIAQHRDLEAAPLAKLLNRGSKTAEATLRARLASYTTQKEWRKDRIGITGRGLGLDLGGLQLGDLNALRELPIVDLALHSTSVTDLRPIAGLPLEVFTVDNTRVSDLSPLRGMKLRSLRMFGTDVSDLSPLAGMPLTELNIGFNKKLRDLKPLAGLPLTILQASLLQVTDLRPLSGLPLRQLLMHYDDNETKPDFSPLAHSPTLEKISLPAGLSDIAFLATLPKLQQVEYHKGQAKDVWMPVAEFLAMYGPDTPEIKAARAALAAAGAKDLPLWRVAVDPDHHLRLDLNYISLTTVAPLRGMPIKRLILAGTSATDLEPLRGMPIQELNLTQTNVNNLEPLRGMPVRDLHLANLRVSDLEPLRGMPLVTVHLRNCSVRDVGILADFPDLEEIELPNENVTNLERLRSMPKLRYLSTNWNTSTNHPAQTVEQFWKEYDAKQAAGKK